MENYRKGKNVEEELDQSSIPIPKLPANVLWMHVKGGSKINYLLTYAFQKFPNENRHVVWSGSGSATAKVISCAEIMKRKVKNLFQITKICYRRIEEYWEPKVEGLDQIVVNRNIPTIHVYLSLDPLDENEPGFQAPSKKLTNASKRQKQASNKQRKQNQQGHSSSSYNTDRDRTPTEQFAAMGVKDNKRKKQQKPYDGSKQRQKDRLNTKTD